MISPLTIGAVWADDKKDKPIEEVVVTGRRLSTGTTNIRMGLFIPFPRNPGNNGGGSSTEQRGEPESSMSDAEKTAACTLTVGAATGTAVTWTDELVAFGKNFKYTASLLSVTPAGRLVKIVRTGKIVGGATTAYHLCVI